MTISVISYFLITMLGTREEKICNESCLALALKELTFRKTGVELSRRNEGGEMW